MMKKPFFRFLLPLCLSSVLFTNANAGGFQLFEENVSALGNAYAGTAASAEDASTAFYNPAGLTLLKYPEIVAAMTAIDLEGDAKITQSTSNSLVGLAFGLPPVGVLGNDTAHPVSWNFVPALHLALPLNRCAALGFSVTSPFGINTDYANTKAKYLATRSKLIVVDVGPSLALQVSRQFSVGAGVDVQYATARINQKVPVGETLPPIPFGGPYPDGDFRNSASDIGYGWNAGVLYELSCATRIGLDYRSRVRHRLEGNADLTLPPPLATTSGEVSASATFPDTVNLSFYHDFNCHWALLASAIYTHWALIDTVTLNFTGPITDDIEKVSLALAFKDTYRFALGANYSPIECLKFRGGIAYDQSPVRSAETRTFRIPDSDRYWVGFGAQYKLSRCLAIDAGYTHLFVKRAIARQTQEIALTNGGVLVASATGDFDISVNEIGVQLTWQIL